MKTHVLLVSRTFPKSHKKAGFDTGFEYGILSKKKRHTLRAGFYYWKRKIDDVNRGEAVLSVRTWDGVPYRSNVREICAFHKGEVGIEKLTLSHDGFAVNDKPSSITGSELSENDGLTFHDFIEWFKPWPDEPVAIIHFTPFRYAAHWPYYI